MTIRNHRSPVRRSTGPDQLTVEACLERASYACEVNGCELRGQRGEGWSLNHRRSRGAGGTTDPRANYPSNLLVVCGDGVRGCHGLLENQLRAQAYVVGWLIRKCACLDPWTCAHAPARTPLWLLRERWVLLDDEGRYRRSGPPEGYEEVAS